MTFLPMFGRDIKKAEPQQPQVKKVAILETVDKMGTISYAHKLMLRTSLAKAITEAEGYEGYDRTDLESLLGEQNFQRTGLVSDEQIKELGKLTGAQYVLVAEAVKVDSTMIFCTAKIIDVETARTLRAENQLMKATPQDIQIGCTTMAGNLLDVELKTGITSSAASSAPVSTNPAANPPKQVTAPPAPGSNTQSNQSTSTPRPQTAYKVYWDGYAGVSFRVTKCVYSTGRLQMTILITNNSKNSLSSSLEREPNLGTKPFQVFDNAGNNYNKHKTTGMIAGNRFDEYGTHFDMPTETSVKMQVEISNFDEEATKITSFTCSFRGMSDRPYGGASLEIKNIPITKQ
ncbi:MAG: hypothetical protein IJ814_06605 [Paludibacteraceae bacterium]|nr:hypothetical protein [Paludibacteraceae bacterium]